MLSKKKALPGLLFYIRGIMLKYKNKKGTSVFRQAQTGHCSASGRRKQEPNATNAENT